MCFNDSAFCISSHAWTKSMPTFGKSLVLKRFAFIGGHDPAMALSDTSPKSNEPRSDLGEAGKGQKRTLTNLYNARPTWFDLAHKKLDAAVFAAYDWRPI
jgi:hypothetical protein